MASGPRAVAQVTRGRVGCGSHEVFAVALSRSLHRLVVATGTRALLAVGAASTAFADDGPPNYVENVQLSGFTIDVHSHLPVVTVSMDCVADASFVRIRLTLTEKTGNTAASSQQTAGASCVGGTSVSTDVSFGPQGGTFKPGKASVVGFGAANNGVTADGVESIP